MQRIRELIIAAHRRSLWQVLGIYLVGAWGAYEVIAEVADNMGMPDWVPGFAIVLFLIGLPIVLATAFVQDGLPGRSGSDAGPADPTLLPDLEHTDRRARTSAAPAGAWLLTWKRSFVAGVTAFLLLGLTAGSYMGLRVAGVGPFASLLSAGTLEERDPIIVAQLAHAAGDTITADAMTEALRVDLAQSNVLSVIEAQRISDALTRMGRARSARLTAELAREVAVREGAKAVLEGEIAPAGSGYLLTARLIQAGTGELLLSRRVSIRNDDDIIAGIDRMSKELRGAIGESLRTVRRSPPLDGVTTSSLTALHRYTKGTEAVSRENDLERGIALLQEAVAEDSLFAMAWRKLAAAYYNAGATNELLRHAATRAYELRDRLTERERYHTIAFYHMNVSNDDRAAIDAYRSLLDLDPHDAAALNNIASLYGRFRQLDLAAGYMRRAVASDSSRTGTWLNLALTEYQLGRREEARRLLDEMAGRFPQQFNHRIGLAMWHAASRDFESAGRVANAVLEGSRGSHINQLNAHWVMAHVMLVQGRLSPGREHLAAATRADSSRGNTQAWLIEQTMHATIENRLLLEPERSVARLRRAVADPAWRALSPADRMYLDIALACAMAGATDDAQALYDEWRGLDELERGIVEPWLEASVQGWIAMSRGRAAEAVRALREGTREGECLACGLATLALAFEESGAADSAIAYYTKYIDTPDLGRLYSDPFELPLAHERLAELYARGGDHANAMQNAQRFIELWQNADAELQPRVRRMQEMIERAVER